MKNKKIKSPKKTGFIQIIIIIIGALVLLKYVYNIDVVGFLTQGRFKELLDQFYSLGSQGWEKYNGAIIRVWNYVSEFAKNLIAKLK
ncbi:MAG: hypothetical protein AAB350_00095 [Patescibacteria group bacterium]